MNISQEDMDKWSIERLKFEVDILRQKRNILENELRKLEYELNRESKDRGRRYPSAVRYIRHKSDRIKAQMEKLKEILRNKM